MSASANEARKDRKEIGLKSLKLVTITDRKRTNVYSNPFHVIVSLSICRVYCMFHRNYLHFE